MSEKNIDDEIRAALSAEDARLLEQFADDPSILEVTIKSMNDRFRWVNVVGMVFLLLFVVLGFLSAWQFYLATEMKPLIGWALAVMFCITTVSMMKMWYWMLINRYDATREIKRLELQVARLSQRLGAN
ncbi:DUF6768 family protein [Bremerella sp. P1]|uniref:DUF6768 family protein n=1 Tax=Bremerella sp. P1 TaxID=3026424 RepID=UPI002367F94E|nr:DUF6768 family protein [Bremerella sp. P1]WDI44181.1 hypothetical protein PSR63_09580 [Bremerella sp. P1]